MTKAKWEQRGVFKVAKHAGCLLEVSQGGKRSTQLHPFTYAVSQQAPGFTAYITDPDPDEEPTRDKDGNTVPPKKAPKFDAFGNRVHRTREIQEPGGWSKFTEVAASEAEALERAEALAEELGAKLAEHLAAQA